MSTNISEKIDQIIALRQKNVPVLQAAKEHCNEAKNMILAFKNFQSLIREHPENFIGEENNNLINKVGRISTEEFYACFNKYSEQLDRMIQRFQRDNLNISFVGMAGQGKSLVMQKVSGLNGNIIPSAEGSDCTGAKSVISNSADSKVKAEIHFFNEYEMVENVNKYLEKIGENSNATKKIVAVSDIPNIDINSIRQHLTFKDVKSQALLGHLEKYVEHYNDYCQYLGQKKEVDESEIEQYVAQYKNGNTAEKYYRYLAVKFANIKCRFPHKDAGKIELVDTIGIGATSLATEEKMLDTVENDSDAIIFMFRPDPVRPRISEIEIDIIDKISNRVSPDYAKEMLFWVVNKVNSGKGKNSDYVPEIIKDINNRNYPIAKTLEVDCISDDDVKEKFLIPVLDQLSSKIKFVDEMLIGKLNAASTELYQAYHKICESTEQAFANSASENLKRQFGRDIKNTHERLKNELRELYLHKYRENCNSPCIKFQTACEEKIKKILLQVPAKDHIMKLLSQGSVNQVNAYEKATDLMRMKIIDDFNNLDDLFSQIVEDMKQEVLHIFADEDKGRLCFITTLKGISSTEWIETFLKKTNAAHEYHMINDALEKFKFYSIKVQGFLIHEVRARLDPIDVSLSGSVSIRNDLVNKDKVADEIVELLKDAAYRIQEALRKELVKFYSFPNRSIFAAIKDLYDRLTYSENDGEDAMDDWRYLYENWMPKIWEDEYQKKLGLASLAQQWNELILKLKKLDSVNNFNVTKD